MFRGKIATAEGKGKQNCPSQGGKKFTSSSVCFPLSWRAISMALVVSQGWYIMHLTMLMC